MTLRHFFLGKPAGLPPALSFRRLAGAVALAGSLAALSLARADEEVLLQLETDKAFGSGPSILDNLYTPGGISVGLFVGHPNNLNRSDRVLLKYDLKPVLLLADKVKRATLLVTIEYYNGADLLEIPMEVEHFQETLDTLTGSELNRPDVDSAAMVTVTEDQAINGPDGVRGIPPLEIDVTEAVKADLKKGNTTASFRLRAPEIEGTHNASLTSRGLVIARGENNRPALQITLEN